jgi:hypothetical protein
MAFLTDRTLATGVTITDLIHIVVTGDTSQNPAGSSFKATMGQVLDLINPTTITGGTYNPITGDITFTNSSGGTFVVTGLVTGYTNTAVTAFTYNNSNSFTIFENDGSTYSASINVVTGLTINGDLNVTSNTTLSATTASTLTLSTVLINSTSPPDYYLVRDPTSGLIKQKVVAGPTVYGLFAQTGNSVAVSATTIESTLIDGGIGSLSVPASGFSIGDSFRADFGGVFSAKNNDTLRIRIKSGSVVLADSGVQTMVTTINDVWQLTLNFTIRQIGGAGVADIVTLGVFHSTKQSNNTPLGFAFNSVNNTTFDTTISNTLDVTAQWSSNSPLNSIYSDIFILNKIY